MGLDLSSAFASFRRRVSAAAPIRFGSFSGTRPISRAFGMERGQPIDRRYIEMFLESHAQDIRGRALEVGDAAYCRRFGADRVERQDVLHLHAGHPGATVTGDLAAGGVLAPASLDTIVCTQTLHLIYDMAAAVREMRRGLAPGGVALVTVPGISQIDAAEWADAWCWSLTPRAARQLFAEVFGADRVEVAAYGNVYAATAFLQGLACEDVDTRKLDVKDPCYPVIVAIRAVAGD